MNERALKTLEYNKIVDRLAGNAGSVLGRELCSKITPLTDIQQIRQLQTETSDAVQRIYQKGTVSFSGIPDVRASVKRLEIGATLGAGELLKISSILTAALRVRNYGMAHREKSVSHKPAWKLEQEQAAAKAKAAALGLSESKQEDEEETDSLSARFSELAPLSPLNQEIQRCILSEEEIADDASPGLKSVRRAIKNTNDKIHSELGAILNSGSNRSMMQDALITMRNGRYCLPIKNEFKNQFQGMVHDQSSSGSTFFIEPMAVVKLNNELRELSVREQEEIEKVLADLSNQAGSHTLELSDDQKNLTELDFIFARAVLSKAMKAAEPKFNSDRWINIRKGRHPLIDPHVVVPTDIYIGRDFDLLIITGPNTGGKTVSLKTVGLFTLLGQSGLHIPAAEGSELGIFHEVYADIGDEQSIEQSLSTFSSHMTNIVKIIDQADNDSLVLFDELGAGTDPTEGAALAMAILTHLHRRTIRTLATTHYSELKVFALSTDKVSNACCEFDVATLRPTYRLLIGIPGKSNAFAISKKLGLPEFIIDSAKEFIGVSEQSFEDLISNLEADRIAIEKEREKSNALRQEAEELKKKWQEKNERIDTAKDKVLKRANEQAQEMLQETKEYVDETIRKFNKMSQNGIGKDMEQERTLLREKLSEKDNKLSVKAVKKSQGTVKEGYEVGDNVLVLSLNVKGKVSTAPNAKGDLYVQIGSLRSLVNVRDLEAAEEEDAEQDKPKSRTAVGAINMAKTMSISAELNLIGMRVDEALPLLDKYLDDAYLSHLPKVTVIHGRGTGALRDAVHSHLKRANYVKSYRVGEFGEGDHGVTIVEFKR